jgi:ABC-type antimicrobial peptide transport system permease subunit
MVLTSVIIALPIGYFLSKEWLDKFAYRISLEWWYFIVAGLVALFITWLTVGSQAIRAARVNPTKSLRSE